jgi:hypothetical protein
VTSSGVSVLMRYTLRLLTLDQLGRAATLICALELERQKDVEKLGHLALRDRLWVGRRPRRPTAWARRATATAAPPARATIAFQNDSRTSPPIPLENCPWCGDEVRGTRSAHAQRRSADRSAHHCANEDCAFTRTTRCPSSRSTSPSTDACRASSSPRSTSSRRCPGSRRRALFGKVERHDKGGFYGPGDRAAGKLPRPLSRRPDHPGRAAPHQRSARDDGRPLRDRVEALCERRRSGWQEPVRPKIVASTATVRRAEAQIRALFGRSQVEVFPPPGPDRRDSFFAHTVRDGEARRGSTSASRRRGAA